MNIKTIDINGLEWFDKINGNSYFSARVIIDYKLPTEKTVLVPFQYGYGDSYIQESFAALESAGIITDRIYYQNGGSESLSMYLSRKNIILRTNKSTALKKVVKAFAED